MNQGRTDIEALAQEVKSGSIRALSRAITLIESTLDSDRESADRLVETCSKTELSSHRIGITGVPGVGKSTYIEQLGLHYIAQGHRVAVLAIDPSSSRSSGSILGDKTRMEQLSAHPMAYIRPSAAASTLGGVARKTREAILLCEAAGFDIVLVETVGVGQSETVVRGMVDSFVLLMLAGAGDELQGIKRGIMEMADVLLVNKVEEGIMSQARKASSDYRIALHMLGADDAGWSAPVAMMSALSGFQLQESYAHIASHHTFLLENNLLAFRRRAQDVVWFQESLKEAIVDRFMRQSQIGQSVKNYRQMVQEGQMTPLVAARKVLKT